MDPISSFGLGYATALFALATVLFLVATALEWVRHGPGRACWHAAVGFVLSAILTVTFFSIPA